MFERKGVCYVCRTNKRPVGVERRPWIALKSFCLTNSRHDPAATAMANPNPNPNPKSNSSRQASDRFHFLPLHQHGADVNDVAGRRHGVEST